MSSSSPSLRVVVAGRPVVLCLASMITIEEAIARIPRWGAAESVVPLGGGITNLNYRGVVSGEAFVVSLSSDDTAGLGVDRPRTYESTTPASHTGARPPV